MSCSDPPSRVEPAQVRGIPYGRPYGLPRYRSRTCSRGLQRADPKRTAISFCAFLPALGAGEKCGADVCLQYQPTRCSHGNIVPNHAELLASRRRGHGSFGGMFLLLQCETQTNPLFRDWWKSNKLLSCHHREEVLMHYH